MNAMKRNMPVRIVTSLAACALLLCFGASVRAQTPEETPPDLGEKTTPEKPKAEPEKPATEDAPTTKVEMDPRLVTGTGPTAPAAVVAAAPPPMVVVGLSMGAFIPTSDLGANFLIGIDATYQLPWLRSKIGVGFDLAYSQPTASGTIEDSRVPGGAAGYSSIMRELTFDLRVSYRFFDWTKIWSPHVAIGPVFYFLSHEVDSLEHEQTETSTQAGFLAVVGADYRLWKGALTGEVRIPFAAVGQKTTGDSNVGAVAIVVGYRFRF